MSPREKKLAAFVGIALVLWFANSGLTRYRGALDRASNAHLAAATELAEAETAVFRGQRAQSRLNRWRRQSLPTDQDVAESLYQDWLKQSLQKSGLEIKSLRDTSTMRRTDEHSHIEVLVEVAGSLQQLTQFLQNFYASNHLHRISKATLAPTEDRRQVNATLNIDGLILPKCPRTDQLAEGAGPLDAQALGDAVKSINARNLFAVYEPNQRTANGNEREFTGRDMWAKNSEAAETKLTSIYQGSYGPLATVFHASTGRTRRYRVGDQIEFGTLRADVTLIDSAERKLIVSVKKQTFEVRLGQAFSEAQPIDQPTMEARRG